MGKAVFMKTIEVVASMTAGRLAGANDAPAALVLLAPGSVIKEACQGGKFFNARFDSQDPPEFIRCWGPGGFRGGRFLQEDAWLEGPGGIGLKNGHQGLGR